MGYLVLDIIVAAAKQAIAEGRLDKSEGQRLINAVLSDSLVARLSELLESTQARLNALGFIPAMA